MLVHLTKRRRRSSECPSVCDSGLGLTVGEAWLRSGRCNKQQPCLCQERLMLVAAALVTDPLGEAAPSRPAPPSVPTGLPPSASPTPGQGVVSSVTEAASFLHGLAGGGSLHPPAPPAPGRLSRALALRLPSTCPAQLSAG